MSINVSKSRLAAINATAVLIQRFVSIIAGFILPRLLLTNYGSTYNGLISSITQVLSCIILLNGGVGGVTRAALYNALRDKNTKKVSSIIHATDIYLHKIAVLFLCIVFLLALVYPIRVKNEFGDWSFVFSLVLIIAITNFSQYFFAFAFQTLLVADQKQYILTIISTITLILSTIFSAFLIIYQVDIRIVKLIAAICFTCSAFIIRYYTINNYNLDLSVAPDFTSIKQRWNAFAHTIANFVHGNTDIIILTMFTNTLEISVYTIYYIAVNGMKLFFDSQYTSIEALFGKTMAEDTKERLYDTFRLVERFTYLTVSFVFIVGTVMILPFVMNYTKGVTDVNYIRPCFATVVCMAEFLYCLRIPYQSMVQAFGHFKQTRNGAILEAVINIIVSLLLIKQMGLIGVAVGTFFAMLFRTVQYGIYVYTKILNFDLLVFAKQFLFALLQYSLLSFSLLHSFRPFYSDSWLSWLIMALSVSIIVLLVVLVFSFIIERKYTVILLNSIVRIIRSRF